MASCKAVFWDVDTQRDFMLPGGRLYVPSAEAIIPNLKRLVDAARQGRVFLVSSADAHTPQDEEFRDWPPHCIQGTPGQQKIPETLTDRLWVVPNRPAAEIHAALGEIKQLVIEKQKLDVFTNPNAEAVLERLEQIVSPDAEFFVFGVVTEYCVRCATAGLIERGKRVAVVTDAIQTLDLAASHRTLEELVARGARLVTTQQALERVGNPAASTA